ncbi:four-carbon acid sugar kinase family protein [Zhaonella formicivorans]|uniref:four-carbon acid sugar kinase family protein n=1 Tax=Zhaonella formicivorans TaxID=2528593 RepID=UPI0010CFE52B|nr:four-carbon acid sugar kinase family protein [Zhaonella formicivorans]
MVRIGIIADDLTGANDTGVQFTKYGLTTAVYFSPKGLANQELADLAVVDTDSRSLPADEAYRVVREAARVMREQGYNIIYKKVDSTLRGNLGAEIDAVLDEFAFPLAVIAPAYPKNGRETLNGHHYLHHVLLHLTEISRDAKFPVTKSSIGEILQEQSRRSAGLISLEHIRSGAEAVIRQAQKLYEKGYQLLVCDAQKDEDLSVVAEAMATWPGRILWVGSAGLADFLPAQVGLHQSCVAGPAIPQANGDDRRVLLIAGSMSEVTRRQVQLAGQNERTFSIGLEPAALALGEESSKQEIERCLRLGKLALASDCDVALYARTDSNKVEESQQLALARGMTISQLSQMIAGTLAEIGRQFVASGAIKGLVLTGGDTAIAVCRALGATGVKLVRELEPGIPGGSLLGTALPLQVVTKAGAFGSEQALKIAMDYLRKGEYHRD